MEGTKGVSIFIQGKVFLYTLSGLRSFQSHDPTAFMRKLQCVQQKAGVSNL